MANATTIYIEKDSIDSNIPISFATSVIKNTSSGYAIWEDFNAQWTGNNLTYTDGYATPTGGTLKSIGIYRTDSSLIQSITTNYVIQDTDTSISVHSLIYAAIDAGDVDWIGSKYDDKFYFVAKTASIYNTIDGRAGTDSFFLAFDSPSLYFYEL